MSDLLRHSFVLLLLFLTKHVLCGVPRYSLDYPQYDTSKFDSYPYDKDQSPANTNSLTNPVYSLARLPLESEQDELKSDGSENVERVTHEKVLKKPLAFSYNDASKVADSKAAATHGHGHGHKGGKHESGGGKTHHSDHHASGGEKGDKGYKGFHENEKSEKGHHDKEGHKGSYSDEGGKKQKHFNEHDYKGEHHKGDKGEKGSKFEEGGKHEKGHSTKGGHSVNKKDHYEKKHEFFDEYYEGGDSEKHGGYHKENDYHKGGSKKGGHHKSGEHHDHYGKKGHTEKGGHYDEHKGHKEDAGHEEHHSHEHKHGKKSDKSGGKKWGYKHGDGGGGKHDAHGSGSNIQTKKQPNIYKSDYADGHRHGYKNTPRLEKRIGHVDPPAGNEGEETSNSYKVHENTDGIITDKEDKDSSALETLESIVESLDNGKAQASANNRRVFVEDAVSYDALKDSKPPAILFEKQAQEKEPNNDDETIALVVKAPVPNDSQIRGTRRVHTNNANKLHEYIYKKRPTVKPVKFQEIVEEEEDDKEEDTRDVEEESHVPKTLSREAAKQHQETVENQEDHLYKTTDQPKREQTNHYSSTIPIPTDYNYYATPNTKVYEEDHQPSKKIFVPVVEQPPEQKNYYNSRIYTNYDIKYHKPSEADDEINTKIVPNVAEQALLEQETEDNRKLHTNPPNDPTLEDKIIDPPLEQAKPAQRTKNTQKVINDYDNYFSTSTEADHVPNIKLLRKPAGFVQKVSYSSGTSPNYTHDFNNQASEADHQTNTKIIHPVAEQAKLEQKIDHDDSKASADDQPTNAKLVHPVDSSYNNACG